MSNWFVRDTNTPLGRLDARMKMALGFFVSVQVVLVDSIAYLLALAVLGLLIFMWGRPSKFQAKLTALSLGVLVWGVILSQGFFYSHHPRTILVQLLPPNAIFADGLNIYRQGLRYGLVQSFRMMAMMLTGYAICFSTEPDQFFRGLVAMRAPFSVSFMAVTAIRFIPIVAAEFATVRTAMRLKGYRPFKLGVRDTLRTEVASLRPVLAGAIRRSEEVALAIVTRGFAFGRARTSLYEQRLRAWHWGALVAMLAMVVSLASCKALFWLYLGEIYYTPALRPLYQFARDWL